jgi:glycosyltransferase involved in cell wall biosynthesis
VSTLEGRRLVHVTTTDMSLALLLGPQLRAFAAAGLDVIGVSAAGPWVEQLTADGIRHETLQHATRSVAVGQDALALGELTRLLRRLRPDIVHTHNPKPGLYGRIAARVARVPVVVNTIHGLYATEDDAAARRTLVYGLERFASMFSDAELLQNIEDVAVLRRLRVPEDKIVVLGNGIDLARFGPAPDGDAVHRARTALGVGPDAMVVGLVGRLVWQKGLRELFEAAAILRHRCPDVVVVVVGPEDRDKADALGEQDIAAAKTLGNVEFLGRRDDVEKLYHGFDMFVLPSYREGFPRAAMEAAASAVAVIASDVRGCRQVVDDGVTGLLVPVRDAGALARAVEALATDADRRRSMGRAGRLKAEAEFDDRRVVATTLAVYQRLLEGRHR